MKQNSNAPQGATHIHSLLGENDNRRFEKWKQTKTKGVFIVYHYDDGEWVMYDTFGRSDNRLKKMRTRV